MEGFSKLKISRESLETILSCIDLTTLNTHDTPSKVKELCKRVNNLPVRFPGFPNVAAVCVYPSLVEEVRAILKARGVGIASVSGGFPSSQTFVTVKVAESVEAVKAGATEIDIVMSVGRFLEGETRRVSAEIQAVREAIGTVKLKVILETGLLTNDQVYSASEICIRAGADFIKTSTGKLEPAASPESVKTMCRVILDQYNATGKKTGIKPAGGIQTAGQALEYLNIVRGILGEEWLNPGLFRIGASSLANHVLNDLNQMISGEKDLLKYF